MTVLNPLRKIDEHIMDDADLAGPILFCFCFGMFLLFVRTLSSPLGDYSRVSCSRANFSSDIYTEWHF
jgi:hypothetical protein